MKHGSDNKLTLVAVLGAMGPGLLAALAGNDAGGIATYSSAGATYGYGTLWILPVMAVLLIVVQETAARCGCALGNASSVPPTASNAAAGCADAHQDAP